MNERSGLILVVDDDRRTRDLIGRLVVLWGYRAAGAQTMADGLAMLDARPDCVILDLFLPDGSGEDVLRAVRSRREPCRVVVCSGETDPQTVQRLRALGADAVLFKPIEPDELAKACLVSQSAAPAEVHSRLND